MNHFLDIHKTTPADLRAMIDTAQEMKTARNGRPKGTPDDLSLIHISEPTRPY